MSPSFLTDTIYRDAKHYWSFDHETFVADYKKELMFRDIIGSRHGYAVGNVIKTDGVCRESISTVKRHGWVRLGNFANECLGNPVLCKAGFTVYFTVWVKLSNSSTSREYLLGTGGLHTCRNGFLIYVVSDYKRGLYMNVDVVADNKLWRTKFPVQVSSWNYVTVTWDLTNGLKTYVNGSLQGKSKLYSSINFTKKGEAQFTLGKVNNAHRYSSASFDEIALWEQVLHPVEIKKIFYGSTNGIVLHEMEGLEHGKCFFLLTHYACFQMFQLLYQCQRSHLW